jgi:trigger factor
VKSVVETLNPTRVRLVVEVPFEELRPSLDTAYRRIGAQVVVPGFRKGKVPPRIIDQRFGRAAVLEEAVNDALPRLYGQAVQDNELQPIGTPHVDVTDLSDGEELKFTAEVDVRPAIELPEWEGLEVRVDDATPTDEEVDAQVDTLRERFGTLHGVDRAATDGDYVVLDLVARRDGQVVEGGEAGGVTYQVGSGQLVDGIDEAVVGLSAGESATFRTVLMGTQDGQEVDCEVTVSAVKEQELPPLDDGFAQLASEFDTLEELRADVRDRVERAKRLEQAAQARDSALEQLLGKVGDLPLPEGVVSSRVEEHFADGHGDDEHRDAFETDLRRNLTAQFVLDEVVKAEQIGVDQEELTSYVLQRAVQAGVDPNELAQQYVQSGTLPTVAADVARGKALALVVERATVLDASGNEIPLDRLREDGTLAVTSDEDFFAGADEAAPPADTAIDPDPTPAEDSASLGSTRTD